MTTPRRQPTFTQRLSRLPDPPKTASGQARKEKRLIEQFGARSEEVRLFRAKVLVNKGVFPVGVEERRLHHLPLAKTRWLTEVPGGNYTAREIKELANKDRRKIAPLLALGMTPDEIVRYRLTKPTRIETPRNQRRLSDRRIAMEIQLASQPDISRGQHAKDVAAVIRERELVRLGFPFTTSAERDALFIFADQSTNSTVMMRFMRDFLRISRDLRRIEGMSKERAGRAAVASLLAQGLDGRRTQSARLYKGTVWEAFLAFLDRMYNEEEGFLAAD